MKRIILLVLVGLTLGSCDHPARKSGWFLGGKDRRIVDIPETLPLPPKPEAPAHAAPPAGRSGPPPVAGTPTPLTPEAADEPEVLDMRGTGVFVGTETPRPPPVTQQDGALTLNFVGADVRDVIKTVLGDTLGQNFTIDPAVQGRITLQSSRPIPRSDVLPTLESALRLNGVALVQTGSLYRVVPAASAARQGGRLHVTGLTSTRGDGFGVEIVPLKYAAAADVAKVLEPLAPPEAVLRIDAARNILIVSGTRREREAIADIVSVFDVDWLSGMSFAMVPLEFAKPQETITDLERVFGAAKGGPLEGLVRFFAIERRNAILVISAQPGYIDRAKSWIDRLDVGGSDEKRLYVYPVENARATDLAVILSQVFSDSPIAVPTPSGTTLPGQLQERLSISRSSTSSFSDRRLRPTVNAQALGPPVNAAQAVPASPGPARSAPPPSAGQPGVPASESSDVLPEELTARIIPDDANNSLVVMARPRVWRMVEEALRSLDIVPLQVLIEATIAEVTLNDELRYGVQSFFNRGSSTFTFSTGPTAALNSTFPGFSYVFRQTDTDIQIVLDALDSVTDIRVISSPQVLVLDNRTAELQVGDQVPISTRQSISNIDPDAPTVNQIEFRDTGVVLRVTPRVNASGVVNLEIEQEESSAVETTSSGIDSPTIQQRRLRSSVVVNSGETIALGGLIRDTRTDSISGIPLLSSIPLLGKLFSSTTESGRRTELLVLITPRVVRNYEEARAVTRDLQKTLHNAAAIYRSGMEDP